MEKMTLEMVLDIGYHIFEYRKKEKDDKGIFYSYLYY